MEEQVILAVLIGIVASVEDLWHREISNWTTVLAVVSGLGLHFYERGGQGLAAAFWSSLAGFCIFLVFFVLGGMGGGDIKLMAGFGAVIGNTGVLIEAAIWTGAIGGVMALCVLAWRFLVGVRRQPVVATADTAGPDSPIVQVDALKEAAQKKASIPYAPAITFGVWLALIAHL